MHSFYRFLGLWALLSAAAPAGAEGEDVFAFIPDGGRSLLESVLEQGAPESLSGAFPAGGEDAEAWRARLDTGAQDGGALEAMDDWQRNTLAAYLARRTPLDPGAELPRDGRDMVLEQCQSCHIVTVVVTQDRTAEAWLRTLNGPSHTEIALSEADRLLLADYLVINAGIPIDLVPPELRAGGASY